MPVGFAFHLLFLLMLFGFIASQEVCRLLASLLQLLCGCSTSLLRRHSFPVGSEVRTLMQQWELVGFGGNFLPFTFSSGQIAFGGIYGNYRRRYTSGVKNNIRKFFTLSAYLMPVKSHELLPNVLPVPFHEGFLIPKGWRIYVYKRYINHDPYLYNEPFVFNPWRWMDRNLDSRLYFMLFGGGCRLCP